jgi:hypothetical protein
VVPANAKLRAKYERREPETTVLWQLVHGWLETFLEAATQAYDRGLPRYVDNELRRYLRCGILAWGFARAYCAACGASMLVAFSCKTRGVCPSCGARRAAQTAANLVDRVIPNVPIRQWVLSAPFALRLPMARDADLLGAVNRIFCTELAGLLQRLGAERGVRRGATGLVAATHLAGGSLNLNPHQHIIALDGVYSTGTDGKHVVFTPTRAPAQSELRDLVERVDKRVTRWLARHGGHRGHRDEHEQHAPEPTPEQACAQLGLRLGQYGHVDAEGVAHGADPDHARFGMRKNTPWFAEHQGWSLHAGVSMRAGDRDGRERLCRYVLRHALSLERMSWTTDGRVAYEVKYPRSPTRTHLLLDPMQFLARITSLIPAPRRPLVRYAGVLSSASRWRPHIVPSEPHNGHDETSNPRRTARTTDVSRTLAAAPIDNSDAPKPSHDATRGCVHAATNYIDWHTLLKRVYDINSLQCPRCGGRLRFIAMLTEAEPIGAILVSMGPPSTPPLPARARSPTLFDDVQRADCEVA